MNEREFGLVWSFGIDDGQLDHLRHAEAFVLGYECALVWERLKSGRAFHMLLHAENLDRVRDLIRKRHAGRKFSITTSHEDRSESWYELAVLAKGE